jgi:hypothetical protein
MLVDIVQTLREQHPDLGPYILALRSGSALIEGEGFSPDVAEWTAEHAPSAALHRRVARVAALPGAEPQEREVEVAAFGTAAELAQFALRWT